MYQQATDCLSHPELLTNFGSFLFVQNQTQRAEQLYRQALAVDPAFLLAKDRLENLSSSLLDRWHFPMLNDRRRNLAFEKAIIKHLEREDCTTVLDIGTGTGLLALMAARAGAERVYACEANEVSLCT